MEGASPEPKRLKAGADATPTAKTQDLTLPQMIAVLGDMHGRANRDDEYFANVHEVMDHIASVPSEVMARVLNLEQGVATMTAQMNQLGNDAKETDETLDNALRE